MSLTEYRRKRQFDRTREPSPDVRPSARRKTAAKTEREIAVERPIFVVQLHHASRRHYDFRLQVGDALKSWAVPKGPSYDPKVKRMAVEVEDHPLSYATFEGEIPEGEYGGGHVALFDQGVWTTPWDAEAQLAKGHLRFELFGEKLKGEWHLVRSGKPARQPQWLLFKEADAYSGTLEADDLLADVTPPSDAKTTVKKTGKDIAKKAIKKAAGKAPVVAAKRRRKVDWAAKAARLTGAKKATLRNEAFEPQLAKLGDTAPNGAQWIHEVKWDGYRLVATMVDGKVRIWSRNAIEWTGKVPELRAALEQLGAKHLAVDGELIAGQGTQADFNLLQTTLSGEQQGALSYVLFDLLHIDGVDLRGAPLVERKALLAELLADPVPHLAFSSHVPGTEGTAAFELASEQQFEGIISKRADRPYVSGRSDDWRKTKRLDSDEFAVVGTTAGQGARSSGFGSLLLARPDPEHGWSYAGRVGSGFSGEQIRELVKHIGKAGSSKPTVHVPVALTAELKRATWFPPLFVVEVFIRGVGNSGVLRQPSLKTVRLDKSPDDLRDSDRGSKKPSSPRKRGSTARGEAVDSRLRGNDRRAPEVRLSSPTKIIFPDRNITKQQVADYYAAVAPRLLPEIAGRPLSIIRCPNGAGAACFFQKHHTAGLEIVRFVRLKEEGGHNANYLVVDDAAGLMELVQFNALEFHPWGAQADDPDRADRVVFDLDPGPGVPFPEVKRSAQHVRELLKQLGLQSFLRTTGGKGLHVVVPLNPANDWSLVKKFAKGFAEALAGSDPERYLATATLKLRPGKIFVDYLRNGRGATAVASYSLRARAGAPVAVPLAWSELGALKRGDAFDLDATLARLKKQRKDPWAGIGKVKQDLGAWG